MAMNVERTSRFKKSYKKLDQQSQKAINKALVMMTEDFSHPSLRMKKMKGYHNPNIWGISANMDVRITFHFENTEMIVLRNCGHHDRTLNNP
ncbi:cytotoxin [Natribacillus halophilus]|uniref:mRNA-degrading endonuclease RelE, toxin component of the RelBE toxin-antitoxin system n=1 Tax=Natribacillus halophilus TaxID=549003 RepID=A0A1G8RJ13_9BACI|nr:cytotoxin [Natribacillus halophilus]SDJ16922.1 mRNA-degrading endonuclease RelE, toxin component of the RelBE toxin-antitoxin system [Natribacillus halophilus]